MSYIENYLKAIVIVHGKSELQMCDFIKKNLRLKIDIISKDKGGHSIQISSIMKRLRGKDINSLNNLKNRYKDELKIEDNEIIDFKIFIIMDTDDCKNDEEKNNFINKNMFKNYWAYDYIVPIYNITNLEDVLIKAEIIDKNTIKNKKDKKNYIKIFPITKQDIESDIKQIEESNIPNYIDQMNGLIWYKPSGNELSFSYMNKSVQFKNGENTEHFYYTDKEDNAGNQIKSVTVNDNTMFVLRSIDDNTYIYSGTIGSEGEDIVLSRVEGGVISESISNTPSIIFNNKLFFMKNNSSSSSDLYVVDLTNVSNTRRPHDSDVAKLNPEAFFTINEKPDSVYLLTKDKGVFRIDGTTVTPVPKLN